MLIHAQFLAVSSWSKMKPQFDNVHVYLYRYPYSVVKQCNQLREKICKKAESITKQAEKVSDN